MTPHEINKTIAGRLGWEFVEQEGPRWRIKYRDGYIWSWDVPDYCHSIRASFEIINAYKFKFFSLVRKPDGWCASFGDGENEHIGLFFQATGETASMAICNAFLPLHRHE